MGGTAILLSPSPHLLPHQLRPVRLSAGWDVSRAELHRWLLVSAAGDGPCVPAPPGPGEKARGQGSGLRKHELELNVAIGSVGNLAEAYLTAAKLANKSWAVYSVSSRKSSFKNNKWDFPGRPVVKIPHFHCRALCCVAF